MATGRPSAALPGQLGLFAGDGDAGDLDPVVAGRVLGEAAPAAADVQHAHAGFEFQLATGQLQLGQLGLVQGTRRLPVAAGVAHRRVEHALEEIVAQVVVRLADDVGACPALQVEEAGLEAVHHPLRRGAGTLAKAVVQQPAGHLVDALAVPPAVHVGLAQAQGALAQHPREEVRVMDAQVLGSIAIEAHAGAFQQLFDDPPGAGIGQGNRSDARITGHDVLLVRQGRQTCDGWRQCPDDVLSARSG
jgi:hypothetical protein